MKNHSTNALHMTLRDKVKMAKMLKKVKARIFCHFEHNANFWDILAIFYLISQSRVTGFGRTVFLLLLDQKWGAL